MQRRRPRPFRTLVTRTAVASAASLALVASGAATALAEDASSTDDVDPSSSQTTSGPDGEADAAAESDTPSQEQDTDETSETPEDEQEQVDETDETVDEVDEQEQEQVDDETVDEVEDTDAVDQPQLAPIYGSQKVRIGVQQADGSWLPEGTSFAGTTMSITITGGVDDEGAALPDASTTCTVPTNSTVCVPEMEYLTGDNALDLDAGRTAVIEPTSVPAGLVIAPASRTVLPAPADCEVIFVGEVCFPTSASANFGVSLAPAARTAATTAGQPVVIDVVTPEDFGDDNAVTGLTVTQQPANGTAVVTGQLPEVPPSPEPEPTTTISPSPSPTETLALADASFAAADAGTARIVYTPNAGFTGTNTFAYSIQTQGGARTGVVTVTVAAAPVVTPPAGSVTPGGAVGAGGLGTGVGTRTGAGLPSTGGPAVELLALGAVLVAAGLGTAASVRRRADRGAGV